MKDLSFGMRMRAQFSFVLSQSTRLSDRQTDGRTDGQKVLGNTVRCIKLHASHGNLISLTQRELNILNISFFYQFVTGYR